MGFFSKKPKIVQVDDASAVPPVVVIANEVAAAVFHAVAEKDTDKISVTFDLDQEQRVTEVHNLVLNGLPKLPRPELLQLVNELTMQLASAPEKQKLKSMTVTIENGQAHSNFAYR